MKSLKVIVLALSVLVLFSACKKDVNVSGVTISQETLMLVINQEYTLTAEFTPSDATNKKVSWSSIDPSVATIDANGKVTGVKEGFTSIVAITEDGFFKDTCSVKVFQNYSTPHFVITTSQSYAYIDDEIDFLFLQIDDKVTDLTNTGNPKITSSLSIKGTQQSSSSVICTGAITLDSLVTAKEDSVAVCVIYDNGTQKYTTFSEEMRVYNNPALKIKTYQSGAKSILLSGTAKHLWTDDCSIVDSDGTEYAESIHYDSVNDYVLDIKPHMWNKTYFVYYGPERRTDSIEIKR